MSIAVRTRTILSAIADVWRSARLSKVALGKYIILLACALHLGWSVLLVIDPSVGQSTPLHTVVAICGGAYRTAFVLTCVAVTAMIFPFLRHRVSNKALAGMLIPQQLALLISGGGALAAVAHHHYADGVMRSGQFILTDQLPIILLSLLYSVAVLEASVAVE